MGFGSLRLLLAAIILLTIIWRAGIPVDPPPPIPHTLPDEPQFDLSSDPTLQGYDYGKRGSRLASAAIVSSLDIISDPRRGPMALITIRKGPDYAANDPDQNGYPGCTLLTALTGEFFEDKDSAQVVLCWQDRQNLTHFVDNLIPGPALGRSRAATWEWLDENSPDAACVYLPLGGDAVSLSALVVYTDVLFVYTDYDAGPEDGPAVIASWDASFTNGAWRFAPRDEVGMGAIPGMDAPAREQAASQIRALIETRTHNRYTLQERYNIGQRDPFYPNRLLEYDSGFDIVPTPPAPIPPASLTP